MKCGEFVHRSYLDHGLSFTQRENILKELVLRLILFGEQAEALEELEL
jgi:hypothetical protein